jgi:cobalamin-dependent methionine synthase I
LTLSQQSQKTKGSNIALSDFIAPKSGKGDYMGAFV